MDNEWENLARGPVRTPAFSGRDDYDTTVTEIVLCLNSSSSGFRDPQRSRLCSCGAPQSMKIFHAATDEESNDSALGRGAVKKLL